VVLDSLERRDLLATLDPTFGTGGLTTATFGAAGGTDATYGSFTRQPDGKYVVVGTATGPFGNKDFAIARLNADGTVDTTFNNGSGVRLVDFNLGGGLSGNNDDIATGVAVQPDGKIVVAGTASGSYIALTRLLPNGDFDLSFESDGKVNTNALQFALPDVAVMNTVSVGIQTVGQSAGNIVVAAGNFVLQFSGVNGSEVDISRVTFTGNTFDPGTPFGPGKSSDTIINDMVIDPTTGKIIVVGLGLVDPAAGDTFEPDIIPFSGMGIARLNPDGSNDFTFGTEVNYDPYIPDPTPPDPMTGIDPDLTDNPNLRPRFTFSLINTSFVTTSVANGVSLGPDGTIYMVGTESQGNRTQGAEGRMVLVRLRNDSTFRGDNRLGNHVRPDLEGFINVDGVQDSSFTAGGVFPVEGIAKGLDVSYDAAADRVVAIGYLNLPNPTRQEFAILRTDRNGNIDFNFANSFGADQNQRFQTVGLNQAPNSDLAQDVIILSDGRIVVAGSTANGATSEIGLVRLLSDQPPTISVSDATVTEGDSDTTVATITVSLSTAYRLPITVNIATANDTAIAGSDYQAIPPTTLTFNPGVSSITIAVPIFADLQDEPDKRFFVNLSGAVLGTITDGQGIVTIIDNDPAPPPPTISISDVSIAEGNAGTSDAVFTVTLSAAFGVPVTVNVATADGTAIAGTDYTPLGLTTLTFAPGDTSLTVRIPIIGNQRFEPDKSFTVNLSGASIGTIVKGQGVGTILNDDAAPPPAPPVPSSFAGVQRAFINRRGRRVFVGLRLFFTSPLDVNNASQTGFYRVSQGNRPVLVTQAQVSGNSVTLMLGRLRSTSPFRVSFGGLISANSAPIAGASLRV